jgi:tRNA threonylcarbamoyladenosine biosynthesis protein TsaB
MDGAPLILSFNTATMGGSVCLVRGEQVLASRFGDPSVSHSSSLLADIDSTLQAASVSLRDVDLLAAAAGPGSFTGLRIGVASIKALSLALRRPCFGIPTLHAVAHGAGTSNATVAVLPAGRGEVFAQLFSVSSAGAVTARDEPGHLQPTAMLERYGLIPNLSWVGVGAWAQRETIEAYATSKGIQFSTSRTAGDGWALLPGEDNLALDIAALAWQRFQNGELESAGSLQAIYVRPSDAELKQTQLPSGNC